LWYPVVIAGVAFVIGLLFLPETKDVDIFAADSPGEPHERPPPQRSCKQGEALCLRSGRGSASET